MSGSSVPSTSSQDQTNSAYLEEMQNQTNMENQDTLQTAQMRTEQDLAQGLSSLITNGASGIKSAASGQ